MDLSQVSRTAILLLICRAVESEKNLAAFKDPMAVLCLERLMSMASGKDLRWITRKKRMYEGFHVRDALRHPSAFCAVVFTKAESGTPDSAFHANAHPFSEDGLVHHYEPER